MKYKNYEFPANPCTVKVKSKREIKKTPLIDKSTAVEDICCEGAVISGSGEFYGDNAVEACMYLSRLFKQNGSGWLICPCAIAMLAYFTAFSYEVNSTKNSVSFCFEFTQDYDTAQYYADADCTFAQADENAFDIADRVGISVSRLMEINNFENAFAIKAGERVKIK